MNIFLDDERFPDVAYRLTGIPELLELDWEIARTFDEFVNLVEANKGNIDAVSFDHDLAILSYDPITQKQSFRYLDKTGLDCAMYLVERDIKIKRYFIHSQNKDERHKIKDALDEWHKENLHGLQASTGGDGSAQRDREEA